MDSDFRQQQQQALVEKIREQINLSKTLITRSRHILEQSKSQQQRLEKEHDLYVEPLLCNTTKKSLQ